MDQNELQIIQQVNQIQDQIKLVDEGLDLSPDNSELLELKIQLYQTLQSILSQIKQSDLKDCISEISETSLTESSDDDQKEKTQDEEENFHLNSFPWIAGETLFKEESQINPESPYRLSDFEQTSDEEESTQIIIERKESSIYGSESPIQVSKVIDVRKNLSSNGIAEWEKYTTGFGSKILLRLGYQFGKGIGKDMRGIAEPIQIRKPKKRTSLMAGIGHINNMQTQSDSLCTEKLKSKRRRNKEINNNEEDSTVFDFLNRAFLSQTSKTEDFETNFSNDNINKYEPNVVESNKDKDKDKDKELAMKLNHTRETTEKLKQKRDKLKQAIARNSNKNSEYRSQLTTELEKTEKRLKNLGEKDKELDIRININKERKNLFKF